MGTYDAGMHTLHLTQAGAHQILLAELLNAPLGFGCKYVHHVLIIELCRQHAGSATWQD